MYFSLASALLLGLASAKPILISTAPTPSDIKIVSIKATGTGCPAGSAQVTIDESGTIFDVAFDQYLVEVGPASNAGANRKNCRVTISLSYPAGFQFSIMETRFSGYASLPAGEKGTCRASYTLSGQTGQELVFMKELAGPYEKNYEMLAGVDIESWSPCGDHTAILNVNSEVRITPVNSPQKGSMTVGRGRRGHIRMRLAWQDCSCDE